MIYEPRDYTAHPGKMPGLLAPTDFSPRTWARSTPGELR